MINHDYKGKALLLIVPCAITLPCRIEEVEVVSSKDSDFALVQRDGFSSTLHYSKSLVYLSKHEANKARLQADLDRAVRIVRICEVELRQAQEAEEAARGAIVAYEPYGCEFCINRTMDLEGWDVTDYRMLCPDCIKEGMERR